MWGFYGLISFLLVPVMLVVGTWMLDKVRIKTGVVVLMVLGVLIIVTAGKASTGAHKEREKQEHELITEVKKIVDVEKAVVKKELTKEGEKEIITEDGVYKVKSTNTEIEYITMGDKMVYVKE